MELVIQPVTSAVFEPLTVDALACIYDLDGFTPMNALLIAYRLDRDHFHKAARFHEVPRYLAICHGDCYERPQVITTAKTAWWADAASSTKEVMRIADCELCVSLRLTHFGFIEGGFPANAFKQCLVSIQSTAPMENLKSVIVDVDSRHIQQVLETQSELF